jgi:hypothetical protein
MQLRTSELDLGTSQGSGTGAEPQQDLLAAENVDLRLLLAQAEINTRSLLAQAGIDAREREASDKLQMLILEELHHRIKPGWPPKQSTSVEGRWQLALPENDGRLVVIVTHFRVAGG